MAQAENQNTAEDPVAEAGRLIVRIIAAINRNEIEQIAAEQAKDIKAFRLCEESKVLNDLLDATVETATHTLATTLAGAMLHVMLACTDADIISSHVEEKHQDHCDRYMRRIERCLSSVLTVLAQVSGIDPATVGGDHYMPPRLDPMARVAKALAA